MNVTFNIKKITICLYVITVLSVIFFLLVPLNFTTDSICYLTGAENLALGKGIYTYNIYYTGNNDLLVPIIDYQPFYIIVLAFFIKVFGVSSIVAARITLSISWLLFIFFINKLYQKYLGTYKYSYFLSVVLLIFNLGLWIYNKVALSESVFIALLVILIYLVSKRTSKSLILKTELYFSFGIAIIMGLIILTRYAGLAFYIALLLFYFTIALKDRKYIKDFFITLIISILPFFIWFLRNLLVKDQGMLAIQSNYSLFDLSRIIEILNFISSPLIGLPTSILQFGYISIIIITILIILYIFIINDDRKDIIRFLSISIFTYLALIIYLYLKFREDNIHSGLNRYIYLIQPILVLIFLIIINRIQLLKIKSLIKKTSSILILMMFFLMLISGFNRTYFNFTKNFNKRDNITESFSNCKKFISPNSLLLSNHAVFANTFCQPYFKQVSDDIELKKVLNNWKFSNNEVFYLMSKNIGVEFRRDAKRWDEILKNIQYKTLYEDARVILIRLK